MDKVTVIRERLSNPSPPPLVLAYKTLGWFVIRATSPFKADRLDEAIGCLEQILAQLKQERDKNG